MLLVSNLEKKFILAALETGCRLDERRPTEFREVVFDFDEHQRGHVTVHLGQSKVLAVVTATATRPYPERPAEGIINYYVAISSLACGTYEEAAERDEEEATLQRLVDRILKNSRTVDTESLCILPGEQCWSLRVDLHVLDHDGALIDAATAAAVAALSDFRRPDTSISDDGSVHSSFERHPVPLALHSPAVALSFALLDSQSATSDHAVKQTVNMVVLADPTHLEESVGGGGRLTMALSKKGELSMVVKTGGDVVGVEVLQNECFFIARERAILLLDQMHAAMVQARSGK